MNKRYRPTAAAARRRRAGTRKSSKSTGTFNLPIVPIIFCALAVIAVYMRFSQAPTPQAFRQTVSSLINGDVDLKDAVLVFGNNQDSIENEAGEGKENAILVFGKKLLGIDDKNKETDENADTNNEYEPPLPNDFDEIDPNDKSENAVGASSDRIFTYLGQVCESPYPIEAVPEIEFALPPEEEQDNTPNKAFKIPSPDVVDDTVYTLPFACIAPIKGRITSKYGYRDHPIDTTAKFHYGVDVAAAKGTKIGAFAAGTVYQTGTSAINGNFARIDHGNGFTSFYAHMNSITCKKGEWINMGQEVGKVGSTGNSTGPHLHFEMRKNNMIICPTDFVELSA